MALAKSIDFTDYDIAYCFVGRKNRLFGAFHHKRRKFSILIGEPLLKAGDKFGLRPSFQDEIII